MENGLSIVIKPFFLFISTPRFIKEKGKNHRSDDHPDPQDKGGIDDYRIYHTKK